MYRDTRTFADTIKEMLNYYGLGNSETDVFKSFESMNDQLVIQTKVDVPRAAQESAVEDVLKIIEYRLGTSGFVKELTAEKDREILNLKEKIRQIELDSVDKLDKILDTVCGSGDEKLSEL